MLANLDANGWVIIIGAIGIIITQVVTQILAHLQRVQVAKEVKAVKENLQATTNTTVKGLADMSQLLNENTTMTSAIVATTGEIEKQGNSRWDEIKKELLAARQEIRDLQQLRIDEAAKHDKPKHDKY